MRFWFIHSGAASLREQIVRQVTLGVLSGELAPGEQLPSTRELARRFQLHPNTVSAAYRQLNDEGWVVSRKGAGVFIRRATNASPTTRPERSSTLTLLLERAVRLGRKESLRDDDLLALLNTVLAAKKRHVLVEAEPELAAIVVHEIAMFGGPEVEVLALAPEHFANLAEALTGAVALVVPSKFEAASAALRETRPPILLRIHPIATWIAANLPVSREHLVAVATSWPRFLESARSVLIGVGFSPDLIVLRDARRPRWKLGLEAMDGVVCDSLTATRLPPRSKPLIFPLLDQAALGKTFPTLPIEKL